MNVRGLKRRLLRIERRISPHDESSFTVEVLCRSIWLEDKRKFLEIAGGTTLLLFARQWEIDEAAQQNEAAKCDHGNRRR